MSSQNSISGTYARGNDEWLCWDVCVCVCVCVCNNADSMKWQVVEERHFKLARDPPYFDVCGIEVHCHDPAKHARQRHSLIAECWLWYLHVSIGHVQVHANHSDSKCFSIHFVTIHIAQCWPTLCHRFDSKGTAWPAINGYCAFANDANVVIAFATHVFWRQRMMMMMMMMMSQCRCRHEDATQQANNFIMPLSMGNYELVRWVIAWSTWTNVVARCEVDINTKRSGLSRTFGGARLCCRYNRCRTTQNIRIVALSSQSNPMPMCVFSLSLSLSFVCPNHTLSYTFTSIIAYKCNDAFIRITLFVHSLQTKCLLVQICCSFCSICCHLSPFPIFQQHILLLVNFEYGSKYDFIQQSIWNSYRDCDRCQMKEFSSFFLFLFLSLSLSFSLFICVVLN